MAVAAILFSTETEFDAATRSAICSSEGLIRFGKGVDFGGSGYTTQVGSAVVPAPGGTVTCPLLSLITANDTAALADADTRCRVILGAGQADGYVVGRNAGAASLNGYYVGADSAGTRLALYRYSGGAFTLLSSTVQAYAKGAAVQLRLNCTGGTVQGFDDTNSISTAAIADATYATGLSGVYAGAANQGPIWTYLRSSVTSLTGSISLPTSTTYKDLGSAKRMGSVSWEEDLASGGDVTVDVYGSDDGASDAAGASVTGLTDPAGSDCSAAGSHRYWRVVANFTRANTTQEPTVSRIALNQVPAAAGGGGGRAGSRRYSPREVC